MSSCANNPINHIHQINFLEQYLKDFELHSAYFTLLFVSCILLVAKSISLMRIGQSTLHIMFSMFLPIGYCMFSIAAYSILHMAPCVPLLPALWRQSRTAPSCRSSHQPGLLLPKIKGQMRGKIAQRSSERKYDAGDIVVKTWTTSCPRYSKTSPRSLVLPHTWKRLRICL